VMAAADHERGGAELAGAREQHVHALVHEPGAGQALAVPQHGGGAIRQNLRSAVRRHAAGFDLFHVAGQQGEAVRVVAQQVAFDQGAGNAVGHRGGKPGFLQQCAAVVPERICAVERGGVVGHFRISSTLSKPPSLMATMACSRTFGLAW
jgi:hypothetical protein